MNNICHVCGYPGLTEPPYDNELPSFEICPCCGYQYGYSDFDQKITHHEWREEWIKKGMVWDKGRTTSPQNWNPKLQLRNIGVIVS